MPTQKVNAIAIDPVTPQNVYLASPHGLFRSTDGGVTLNKIDVELSAEPLGLTLNPSAPSMLFVLLADGTLMLSDDGGETWTTVDANQ